MCHIRSPKSTSNLSSKRHWGIFSFPRTGFEYTFQCELQWSCSTCAQVPVMSAWGSQGACCGALMLHAPPVMLQVESGGHGTGHLHPVWAGPPAVLKAARLEATAITSTAPA